MRNPRYNSSLIALACAVLATFFLIACQQSQQPAAPAATQSAAAPTEKVFVVFEGPWAIVPDPKDANSVLVLAPKTKLHRDLYVSATNESTLTAGTYDLSVPAHGPVTSAALDPSFAQTKIDAKSLMRQPNGQPYPMDGMTVSVAGGTRGIGPVLQDGWNNPIIFVPKGGMKLPNGTRIVAVDGQPFWASAGQDGSFGNDGVAKADDNVYSTDTKIVKP